MSGNGYLSIVRTGLTVTWKSQILGVPSFFITGTMGVAHSLVLTGSRTPLFTNLPPPLV